jgi:hypothetical protein
VANKYPSTPPIDASEFSQLLREVRDLLLRMADPPANVMPSKLAAEYLGVCPRTLFSLTKSGAVPAKAIGNGKRKRWLYRRADLDAWLSNRTN